MGVSTETTETTMTVREAREQFGKRLDLAHYTGEITIVTRYGQPWAAIVPLDVARPPAMPDRPV
jgi:antitoxin (DNA-binding transcriptional repressor) of toxin-antitoxin stability system